MAVVEPWDGVPLNPEKDGAHWLCISQATGAMMAFQWNAPPGPDRVGAWTNISKNITTSHPLDAVRMGLSYVAPCILPADHAAAVQAERAAGIEKRRSALFFMADEVANLTDGGVAGSALVTAVKRIGEGSPMPAEGSEDDWPMLRAVLDQMDEVIDARGDISALAAAEARAEARGMEQAAKWHEERAAFFASRVKHLPVGAVNGDTLQQNKHLEMAAAIRALTPSATGEGGK